jgi:glyoxylate reductase
MREKILITRQIPTEGLAIIEADYDLVVNVHDRPLTHDELLEGVKEAVGLLCLLTDRIDAALMDAAPRLLGIANYAVGYDNIDIRGATARGIPVSNTPGVLTDATAELAVALIFACARRVCEAQEHLRKGLWDGWAPMQFLGADIKGATIGIVGMGKIGQAVALRGHGLGMTILYHDETPVDEKRLGFAAKLVELDELLAASDFVSLHVPLTDETRHLIGEKELSMMKPTAFLINTSRGPVVDEEALVGALETGLIRGAGLDVYEREPKVHPGLLKLDNCVLLPHIASATWTARTNMALMAAGNLAAMIKGREIPNLVNPGYTKNRRVS